MMARLITPDEQGIKEAGEELRAGRLIAFPTETVYGLGANALDQDAVLSVFAAKQRPQSDPLIVHVPCLPDALALLDLTPKGTTLFTCLAEAFWPGPLTMIAKAVPEVPLAVSASTGFVGIRCPKHPIALQLLRVAKVPVAAPSANRFGHVSPTCAQHVLDDLGACDHLGVLDDAGSEACEVGIESTVIKLVPDENRIQMLRRGGVSEAALLRVLIKHADDLGGKYVIEDAHHVVKNEGAEAQIAPGQLLTHYAPDVSTFIFQEDAPIQVDATSDEDVASWAVLDFNGRLAQLKSRVCAYRDLSSSGDMMEASHHIFEYLRWAETVPGVKQVVLTDVSRVPHEHAAAVFDRMFRAASGKLRSLRL